MPTLHVFNVEFFAFGDTDNKTIIAYDEAEVHENYFGTIISVSEIRIATEADISKYNHLINLYTQKEMNVCE